MTYSGQQIQRTPATTEIGARERAARADFLEVVEQRWLRGRERNNHGAWVGQAPLLELIEEQADAVNYAREHARRRPDHAEACAHLEQIATYLALRARELLES